MSTLLFDIDGTLRNYESTPNIDPKLLEMLLVLKKQHSLIVVTGRTFLHFNNFVNELIKYSPKQKRTSNVFDCIFCEDGHICYNHGHRRVLINNLAKVQINILKRIIDLHINKYSSLHQISYPEPDMVAEVSIMVQGDETIDKYKNFLEAIIMENKLDLLKIKLLTHNRLSIGIKNVDKNSAIVKHQIDLSETYFFCDEINDLTLATSIVEKGGKIICPANAVKEIKRIAYYISSKEYSYGVTDYLSIFLTEKQG